MLVTQITLLGNFLLWKFSYSRRVHSCAHQWLVGLFSRSSFEKHPRAVSVLVPLCKPFAAMMLRFFFFRKNGDDGVYKNDNDDDCIYDDDIMI